MGMGAALPPMEARGLGSGPSNRRPAEPIRGSLPWPRLSEFLGAAVSSRKPPPGASPPEDSLSILDASGDLSPDRLPEEPCAPT
jgi:hypothetical protein